MKKLIFILALLNVCVVHAQTKSSVPTKNHDVAGSGHFLLNVSSTKGIEHLVVNYGLYPNPVTDVLNLNIRTSHVTMLSLDIVDASGTKVISWTPEQASYTYSCRWNVAKLSHGSYQIIIYDQNKTKVYTASFDKA